MAASMNHQSKFGIVASDGGAVTSQYKFRNWAWTRGDTISENDGISGTRSHHSEQRVQNVRAPSFSFELYPNSVELDVWLPYILGANESSDTFALAETLPMFDANYDMGGTRRFYLQDCKVDRAVFSGRQGDRLRLQLFCEALTLTDDGTTFPSLTPSAVPHYIYSEAAIVINSQALRFREWSLEIDNALVKDRWLNSQTRISLPEGDRIITWTLSGPYGDNTALYDLAATGVAATATFTKGNRSLLFSSSKVSFPVEVPSPEADRGEIMLPLMGIAGKDGSTLELVTTNDSSA